MSPEQVSSSIRRGFAGIVTPGSFKFLDCIDNKHWLLHEQEPDGSLIISHKSAVYLMRTAQQLPRDCSVYMCPVFCSLTFVLTQLYAVLYRYLNKLLLLPAVLLAARMK